LLTEGVEWKFRDRARRAVVSDWQSGGVTIDESRISQTTWNNSQPQLNYSHMKKKDNVTIVWRASGSTWRKNLRIATKCFSQFIFVKQSWSIVAIERKSKCYQLAPKHHWQKTSAFRTLHEKQQVSWIERKEAREKEEGEREEEMKDRRY
jgi:hypothetical protein